MKVRFCCIALNWIECVHPQSCCNSFCVDNKTVTFVLNIYWMFNVVYFPLFCKQETLLLCFWMMGKFQIFTFKNVWWTFFWRYFYKRGSYGLYKIKQSALPIHLLKGEGRLDNRNQLIWSRSVITFVFKNFTQKQVSKLFLGQQLKLNQPHELP